MFVLHRYNKEQEEKQEQERKKNELAALSQTDTKGGNYVHLAEKLRGQLRHNALNVVDSIDHRIQTVTDTSDSRSCPSPQSKQAGYQRSAVRPEPGTARASPGNTHHPEMTVSRVRRFWARGYRLTSTELDWMFFVLFDVTSTLVYVCIMFGR